MKFESTPGPAKTEKGPKKERDTFFGFKTDLWGYDLDFGVGSKEKDLEIRTDSKKKEMIARTTPDMAAFYLEKVLGTLSASRKRESEAQKKAEDFFIKIIGALDTESLEKFVDTISSLDAEEKSIILKNMEEMDDEKFQKFVSDLVKHSPEQIKRSLSLLKKPKIRTVWDVIEEKTREGLIARAKKRRIEEATKDINDFKKQSSIAGAGAEKPPEPAGKSEAELIKDIMDMFKKI